MTMYEILKINPLEVKIHLAVWNGSHDPIDLFFENKFKSWQEKQNKRNFQRKYIISLIRMNKDNQWLFAGVYKSLDVDKSENGYFQYQTEITDHHKSLIGRLIIKYKRKGRNSYPNGENLKDDAFVYEIKPERIAFSDFKDFREVNLSRNQLEILFRQKYPSWKSALSSVAGVYLISDTKTGKLYVGSAYGENGFWARWDSYYKNYHGGNKGLKKLFEKEGNEAFKHFNYSILETCDIDLTDEAIIQIENRWKERLLTRNFGYNEN